MRHLRWILLLSVILASPKALLLASKGGDALGGVCLGVLIGFCLGALTILFQQPKNSGDANSEFRGHNT